MDPLIEAVARAACQADGLDPDLMVDHSDYEGGARSVEHHQVPQWHAHVAEAAKFVAMHRALAGAHGAGLEEAGAFTVDESEIGGPDVVT